MNSFVPDGSVIERWKEASFDKVRSIRSKLKEDNDIIAARELKLYIEHDRQQLIPIIENVQQKKLKNSGIDHFFEGYGDECKNYDDAKKICERIWW